MDPVPARGGAPRPRVNIHPWIYRTIGTVGLVLAVAGLLGDRYKALIGAILLVPACWCALNDPRQNLSDFNRTSARVGIWAGLFVIAWTSMMIIVWGSPN